MPKLTVNDTQIHYEEKGAGYPVVLLHGLTFDRRMWDHQVEGLARSYRAITVDLRGHGLSASPDMEYDLDMMTEDVHQAMRELGIAQAHVVGLSMGGMIGMRLALDHPEAVRSLVLLDTSAEPEPADRAAAYEAMAGALREQGPGIVADGVMSVLFSSGFLLDQPDKAKREKERLLEVNRVGVSNATSAVTRRKDISDRIHKIKVPTLVIVGEVDAATPLETSQVIQAAIPGSRLEIIPSAGHMTPIEKPEEVSQLIVEFLGSVS
jgi:3-oxoadipate enol-lactonase